jgi:hypothetical protein
MLWYMAAAGSPATFQRASGRQWSTCSRAGQRSSTLVLASPIKVDATTFNQPITLVHGAHAYSHGCTLFSKLQRIVADGLRTGLNRHGLVIRESVVLSFYARLVHKRPCVGS